MSHSRSRQKAVKRVAESRARLIRGFTHDIKNPLSAADGLLALLEEGAFGPLNAKQAESVLRARRSIGAALGLVAHLLDLARAEAGDIEMHHAMVNIRATVGEVSDDFCAAAERKGLRLILDDAESDEMMINSDHDRIRQVLSNLVSNAVKYTPAGGTIRISWRLRARGADGASDQWAAIDVADDGPGISHEQQRTLFEEFARFDPGAAAGTGIGLAIASHIARALGGTLSVVSAVGVGSTFTLLLPAKVAHAVVNSVDPAAFALVGTPI